jgi:hypothetical protein
MASRCGVRSLDAIFWATRASLHEFHQVLKLFDRGRPLGLGQGIEHAGQLRESVCLFRVLGLDRAKGSDKPSAGF